MFYKMYCIRKHLLLDTISMNADLSYFFNSIRNYFKFIFFISINSKYLANELSSQS
jgi:hypothetical protein